MQTFLPYKSFTMSLQCLDDKRLGKQIVEAKQILNALMPGSTSKWKNHPAVRMWRGHEHYLRLYRDLAIDLWKERGFNNSMDYKFLFKHHAVIGALIKSRKPIPWLTQEFCAAHRSNLLRKDPVYYSQFGWTEPNNLPYIWPV